MKRLINKTKKIWFKNMQSYQCQMNLWVQANKITKKKWSKTDYIEQRSTKIAKTSTKKVTPSNKQPIRTKIENSVWYWIQMMLNGEKLIVSLCRIKMLAEIVIEKQIMINIELNFVNRTKSSTQIIQKIILNNMGIKWNVESKILIEELEKVRRSPKSKW